MSRVQRRDFLIAAGSILAVPAVTVAQPVRKIPRVGYLASGSRSSRFHEAFQEGLRELGWVDGQNIVIDYRFADGKFERLPELAAELVRANAARCPATDRTSRRAPLTTQFHR